MGGQILLDNASRGTTTLLSSCVPATTSDALLDGTTPGDKSGDSAFNFGRKLKQWAADINSMMTDLYGVSATITVTLPSGNVDNWTPAGYQAGVTKRIIFTPTDLTSTLLGMLAAPDGWTMRLINASALIDTPVNNGASSIPANDFLIPGAATNYIRRQTIQVVEYVSAIGGWMFHA